MAEQFAGPWLGRAVNVRHQAGTWVIGCSLFREFSDADLRALLATNRSRRGRSLLPPTRSVTTSPPPARRNGTARACDTVKAADLKPAGMAQSGEGATPCRQAGGGYHRLVQRHREALRRSSRRRVHGWPALAMPRAPLVGSMVKVRASNAGLAIPWTTVRVKHCRRENHQWIVGCQFTEPLPDSILELFC